MPPINQVNRFWNDTKQGQLPVTHTLVKKLQGPKCMSQGGHECPTMPYTSGPEVLFNSALRDIAVPNLARFFITSGVEHLFDSDTTPYCFFSDAG